MFSQTIITFIVHFITEEENYLSPLVGSVVCGYLLSSPSKGNSVKGSEPFERWLEGPCSFLVWGGVELAEGGGREVRLNRNCRKRQWQATPVLLPRKSHGWRSLVGCSPWGIEESDTTERLHFHFSLFCIEEGNGNPLQWTREPGGLPSMGSHRVRHN